jgi:hypothetical protein
MVCGTSTGVNLTDGLDGLAAGASIPALGAYVIIGIWEFRNDCTVLLMNNCYTVRDPLDIAVVASSVMGACWGFLWWNAPPAKIFMGDTGSHQQIPASRSPQTHSDGSDIRLHHYAVRTVAELEQWFALSDLEPETLISRRERACRAVPLLPGRGKRSRDQSRTGPALAIV